MTLNFEWLLFSVMDLQKPPGKIFKEKLGSDQLKADCTLTLSQDDLISMVDTTELQVENGTF